MTYKYFCTNCGTPVDDEYQPYITKALGLSPEKCAAQLIKKASARLSSYTCNCGSTSRVTDLEFSDKLIVCPYCKEQIDNEHYNELQTLHNM
jgi:DNA-directed RNA polymerase subunit RPC12/RpoP